MYTSTNSHKHTHEPTTPLTCGVYLSTPPPPPRCWCSGNSGLCLTTPMREDGLVRLLPTEAGLVLRRTEEDPGNNALSLLLLLLLLLAVVVVEFLEYLCCCEVDSWFELPPEERKNKNKLETPKTIVAITKKHQG